MVKKGGSKHLKRLPAPTSWPIHRKEFKWVVKPAGPHSINSSLPLLLVVREVLGLVKNRREAKIMLSGGNVKVDGKVRRSDDYAVGIMDVVEVLPLKKAFRVLPSRKELLLHPISEDEKAFKLCEVVDVTNVKEGHLQIHLHDGKNILVKAEERQSGGDVYNVHDLLKISVPSKEVLAHLKFEKGVLGIVDNGKNRGALVEVAEIARKPWPSKTMVILKDREGNQFETTLDYVFPIGKGEPWISIPEEGNA
jgi:small subunit ribosomal protein S4e